MKFKICRQIEISGQGYMNVIQLQRKRQTLLIPHTVIQKHCLEHKKNDSRSKSVHTTFCSTLRTLFLGKSIILMNLQLTLILKNLEISETCDVFSQISKHATVVTVQSRCSENSRFF